MDRIEHVKISAFTILELLIVLFIFSIVIVMTYTSLTTYSRISKAQEDSLMVSQNVRATLDLISNYIRMAGFGTKYSLSIQGGNNVNGFTQVFNAVDNSAEGADRLTVVFASRLVGNIAKNNAGALQYSGNKIYINSTKINLLDNNKKKYVFFERNPFNEFFELISSPTASGTGRYLMNFPTGSNINAYFGDNVYAVRAITIGYDSTNQQIILNENTGSPTQPLASDIETIQFQYGIDENNDGILDDTDNDGIGLDNTVPPSKEMYLKIVKVSILAKAPHSDYKYKDKHNSYTIANYIVVLDKNDNNGLESKYDWHFRRKLIQVYVSPRNYENNLF